MVRQEFDGEIEFLFIDGRSEDRTRAILEELAVDDPRIRVLDNPDRTTAFALNVGLAASRGRFVARMDGHTSYPPRYLADGVERLARGDVVWVAGPQIPRGEGVWSRRVAMALETGLASIGSKRWGDGSADGEGELDTGVFKGVWPRSVLEQHGGWDSGFPINQDSALAARVLAAGPRILQLPPMGAGYVPRNSLQAGAPPPRAPSAETSVAHPRQGAPHRPRPHPRTSSPRQSYPYGLHRGKTARLHANSLRRSHLLGPGLVLALAAALVLPRPLRGLARAAVASYFAALVAASVRAALASPERAADAATLPVVFVVMHGSWGTGFIVSSFKHGPPLRALARVAGLGR